MKCSQDQCPHVPFYRYTWPGKAEAGICTEHVNTLRSIADAIGLPLQVIRIDPDLPNGGHGDG